MGVISIIADETTDISTVEQVSLCLRSVGTVKEGESGVKSSGENCNG